MRIIADGGSTKIDWVLYEHNVCVKRYTSVGINPTMLSEEDITEALRRVADDCPQLLAAEEIEFYGAGCTPVASPKMMRALRCIFVNTTSVIVDSDIIGAARSLFGSDEGIACILGTGACSCQWGRVSDENGESRMGIVSQVPALGFILGDEGSGAVLGKLLINALYKGALPASLRMKFEKQYDIDMYGVIERVYRQPQPNRWLASLSPFVHAHLHVSEIERLVEANLHSFFVNNILPYQRLDLPVSFVGSIAYYYEKQLRSVAEKLHINIGTVKRSPL